MIYSLQYLRGVAALLVVIYHAFDRIAQATYTPNSFMMGQAGVDIFFVISGFIMWVTTSQGMSPYDFIRKRIVRIVPIYWLLTLTIALIALVMPSLLPTTVFDFDHLITSLFFVASFHPTMHTMQPMVVAGWTLNYEMAFYALFALCLFLPKSSRLTALICTLCLTVIVGWGVPNKSILAFYTSSIILEFAAGALLGSLWQQGFKLSPQTSVLAVVVGFLGLWLMSHSDLPRALALGIPAILIVTGTVSLAPLMQNNPSKPAALLGDASYSLYLVHGFVMSVASKVWAKIIPLGSSVAGDLAFLLFSITASVICGVLLYLLVEKPLLKWMTRKSRRQSLGASPKVAL